MSYTSEPRRVGALGDTQANGGGHSPGLRFLALTQGIDHTFGPQCPKNRENNPGYEISGLELRGHGAARLANAVPRFSNFGQSAHPAVLSELQRRALLASFDRTTATGLRDHGLALCMVDLGLRPSEAAKLTLQDVDWETKTLAVPKTKTDRGRELPLAAGMVSALRRYVQRGRPATECQSLFVRPDASGAHVPMDARTIGYAMKAAYRRCKFPREWNGSYRLRHTFATRLHARGADLKEIADLLGHQHLQTTTIYAQVDPVGLRALALPWPLSS